LWHDDGEDGAGVVGTSAAAYADGPAILLHDFRGDPEAEAGARIAFNEIEMALGQAAGADVVEAGDAGGNSLRIGFRGALELGDIGLFSVLDYLIQIVVQMSRKARGWRATFVAKALIRMNFMGLHKR